MRRGERPAAVGRLYDHAAGTQPCDDPVAGQVCRAVLPRLRVELRDQCPAVVEDVARHGRVLCRHDAGERVRQYRDGSYPCGQGCPVCRDVDAERQPAHDAESRNLCREPLHQPVAHRLPVGCCPAGADHRDAACREGGGVAFQV